MDPCTVNRNIFLTRAHSELYEGLDIFRFFLRANHFVYLHPGPFRTFRDYTRDG